MKSLVLFSKKLAYRMCLFSLTEPEFPEMQSVCISDVHGLVKMPLISGSACMMMIVYATVIPCCVHYIQRRGEILETSERHS